MRIYELGFVFLPIHYGELNKTVSQRFSEMQVRLRRL